jgi:hypothetical protein
MHDLLIALAFIGMVFAPAIVAARSGIGSDESEEPAGAHVAGHKLPPLP